LIYFKINSIIKAIKYKDKKDNIGLKLYIEIHNKVSKFITINLREKDIKKINKILEL